MLHQEPSSSTPVNTLSTIDNRISQHGRAMSEETIRGETPYSDRSNTASQTPNYLLPPFDPNGSSTPFTPYTEDENEDELADQEDLDLQDYPAGTCDEARSKPREAKDFSGLYEQEALQDDAEREPEEHRSGQGTEPAWISYRPEPFNKPCQPQEIADDSNTSPPNDTYDKDGAKQHAKASHSNRPNDGSASEEDDDFGTPMFPAPHQKVREASPSPCIRRGAYLLPPHEMKGPDRTTLTPIKPEPGSPELGTSQIKNPGPEHGQDGYAQGLLGSDWSDWYGRYDGLP
ncbi:MAG: hypothetical protein Q9160_009291 [Pyrenula sp. 1 TL-2023]